MRNSCEITVFGVYLDEFQGPRTVQHIEATGNASALSEFGFSLFSMHVFFLANIGHLFSTILNYIYIYVSFFNYQRVIIKYQTFHRNRSGLESKTSHRSSTNAEVANFKGVSVRIYTREKPIRSVDASLDCFEDGFGRSPETKRTFCIKRNTYHIILI